MKAYKFLSLKYGLDTIKNQRLKVATLHELNDPFELYSFGLSNKVHRELFRNWKRAFTLSTGLLCYSKSWHNPLLWSHYGDRHKGVVLEFEIQNKYVMDVLYESERLVLDLDKELAKDKMDIKIVHRLMATKFSQWKYEDEIRMMIKLSECKRINNLFFYDIGNEIKLTGIIQGPLCKLDKNSIAEIIKKNSKIELIKSRLAFTTFSVVQNKSYKKMLISGKA
jgi:hypothetical protein